jgi:hypothetical protein
MKIYLGNSQDIELDLDEEDFINIYPIALARGKVFHEKRRETYVAECWTGVISTQKSFWYKKNDPIKTKEEAEKNAYKHFEENNKNTIHSMIPIQIKDIDDRIIKYFRYIQPSIDYPYQEIPINPYWLSIWLGDGHKDNTGITNVDQAIIDFIYKHAADITPVFRNYGTPSFLD